MISCELNLPFWSNYSVKDRYIVLPNIAVPKNHDRSETDSQGDTGKTPSGQQRGEHYRLRIAKGDLQVLRWR